ncbi:hypothetical protein HYH03_003614 [Edaphochlamys debaryana]|uniref:Protein kinase domain-containing protein n=1 Tax=Edaphochlamys debaryana TaxID=47281 RepID=A0A836C331_9CHLO|nr:hypothetical protein HYH03_003614 [Edaphochlamys debaryana]|eukprot:KAG2498355.1 hypothetical protein HYH03_003614 [Edaphochlamys debaryana]
MTNVQIHTDCWTLETLRAASWAAGLPRGPGYLYVDNYTNPAATVMVSGTNITCHLPAIQVTANGAEYVNVSTSDELLDALVASQITSASGGSAGAVSIQLVSSVSASSGGWIGLKGMPITRNVTIRGVGAVSPPVLDLHGGVSVLNIMPGAVVTLEDMHIVNAGQLRGEVTTLAVLPLMGIPLWFFNFTRIPLQPQLVVRNVVSTLPPTEFSYLTLWAVVVTTDVTTISEAAAVLKSTTPIVKNGVAPNRDSINFERLLSTGFDLYNTTITAKSPDNTTFPTVVLDNPLLTFTLDVVTTLNQLPVYDLNDLMTLLQKLQDNPPSQGTAIYILRNITIDPAVWPPGGYNMSQPLLLVGQTNVGIPTWIDFRRTPVFVTANGCTPDMYYFIQGIQLVNLPNALLQSGTPRNAAQYTSAGLDDMTIYLSNFVVQNTACPEMLYLNQSTAVVTYREFSQLYYLASKHVGMPEVWNAPMLGATVYCNSSLALPSGITIHSVRGWGWNGYKVNITWGFPAGVNELYGNVYDPPSPPIAPPSPPPSPSPPPTVAATAPSSSSSSLEGWQVALIVIGCVAFVALVAGLIGYRVVARYKDEVEAVKSGSTEKKSASSSGDNDPPNNGPGRLGSSGANNSSGGVHTGGTGGMAGVVVATATAKGTPQNGGTGNGNGNANGAGTSEDSTTPTPHDRPPLEVLHNMMATLTQEMDDRHLTILEVIGQGGFGVVYKGQWKGLNVAVKTITFQDRVAGGEKAQHRAILEAAISSSLAHPNVVTTYSYDIKPLTVQHNSSGDGPDSNGPSANGQGTPGGGGGGGTPGGFKIVDKRTVLDWKLYLIQEYCDGGSLRTAILKRKFFDAKKGEPRMEMILDTCAELTGGLVHLHERNIVHGDLNPNNVLLKRDPSKKYGAICKIADFGLSIRMNADQSHISNMRRGTPFYTCPQILAKGNMTKAADVYSMGVMMWEIYHSTMSYRSLPSGFAPRENFPHFPRKAPYDFARVVGACLDAEPSNRPTFAALKADLEAQLAALKQTGTLRTGEDVLGADPNGDAVHMAACQD